MINYKNDTPEQILAHGNTTRSQWGLATAVQKTSSYVLDMDVRQQHGQTLDFAWYYQRPALYKYIN